MYKIFLVDDEKYVLLSLKASVDWAKYDFEICGEAYEAETAIKKINTLKPDLVFSDVSMPGMDGLTMIEQIHKKHPGILFVAISGYAEFQFVKKALSLGVIDYCLKPFDIEEINKSLIKCKKIIDQRIIQMSENAAGTKSGQKINQGAFISPESVKSPIIKSILELINENYTVNYTIPELSQKFLINENYFSQLFKKETGEAFVAYTMKLRMHYALELLQTTNLSVTKIAEMTGYPNYFYFAKIFKRTFNVSPSECRDKD